MLFLTLYSAVHVLHPGSFQYSTSAPTNRPSELLCFSLITLSTIGYGDIVPVYGEARMFAALEGMIGVLYVAITVARPDRDDHYLFRSFLRKCAHASAPVNPIFTKSISRAITRCRFGLRRGT